MPARGRRPRQTQRTCRGSAALGRVRCRNPLSSAWLVANQRMRRFRSLPSTFIYGEPESRTTPCLEFQIHAELGSPPQSHIALKWDLQQRISNSEDLKHFHQQQAFPYTCLGSRQSNESEATLLLRILNGMQMVMRAPKRQM